MQLKVGFLSTKSYDGFHNDILRKKYIFMPFYFHMKKLYFGIHAGSKNQFGNRPPKRHHSLTLSGFISMVVSMEKMLSSSISSPPLREEERDEFF